MKRFIFVLLIVTFSISFSAAQAADNEIFRQEGIASWYGKEFEGRPTASGEIFDPGQFTAAHINLPFGTILTVTNLQNKRQVTVKINDRGPFVSARIIDLSRAAAEVLDMIATGTAPVLIERAQTTTLGPVAGAAAPVITVAEPSATSDIPDINVAGSNKPDINVAGPETISSVEAAPGLTGQPDWAALESMQTKPPTNDLQAQPDLYGLQAQPPTDGLQAQQPVDGLQAQPSLEMANVPQNSPQANLFYPAPAARILGGIPPAESLKSYRLQVGAFKVPRNAIDVFNKLKNAGLNPAYEQNGEFYRVVLAGLKAAEIPEIAQTLGNSGFPEALIREEY